VLDVLKKEKAHQQFAQEESVRTLDYQQCLEATQTGNGQAVAITLRPDLAGDTPP
jgi:hypothetical protein